MHRTNFIRGILALGAVGFFALAGCGPSRSPVVGELVPDPKQKTNEGDRYSVALYSDSENLSGEADADMKFAIPNVAAGTYKVRVTHYVAVPAASGTTKPQGKGAPPSQMPVARSYPDTVTVPGGPIKIDLAKLADVKSSSGMGGPPRPSPGPSRP